MSYNTYLYYGNGEVTIEGSGIRGVQIKYRGAISIKQTANNNFAITANENNIIIFPIGEGFLNKLFNYVGEFRISSVIVADNNSEKMPTTITRVIDYSELINSTSETMTTKSEDLSSSYISGGRIAKTIVGRKTINNLQTDDTTILYLEDGTEYQGKYHIHIKDRAAMTGAIHTKNSQDLYYKKAGGKPVPTRTLVSSVKSTRSGNTGGRSTGGGGGY